MSARDVLFIWERGRSLHQVDRALLILAAVYPEVAPASLAHLPIGERDEHLIRIHAQTFGERLEATSDCPSCAAALEFSFSASDFVGTAAGVGPAAPSAIEAHINGITLRLRSPDSYDLAAVACLGADEARRTLLARVVESADRDGAQQTAAALPPAADERIAALLAERNACSDIRFDVHCESCGHNWATPFDILEFLWAEISALARGIAQDVVRLARAFGWSESEILSLSAARRKLYLDMAA